MKNFEVEVKYRVEDFAPIEEQLEKMGAIPLPEALQCDTYFQHPCRDFSKTDEALRIRQSTDGVYVSYKGPKVDKLTKTREELEFPIGQTAETKDQYIELFNALGFSVAMDVEKSRREFKLEREGRLIKVALDSVAGIGSFVELETECSQSEIAAGREVVMSLAEKLSLSKSIQTSYLEMVMRKSRSHGISP